MGSPQAFLEHAEAKKKRAPCQLAPRLAPLDDRQRDDLDAALALPVEQLKNADIAEFLKTRWGVQTNWQQVSVHRRGECDCPQHG